MIKRSPFRYFKTSPEIIRLAVMMYVRFPLSLQNVEDLLNERGIDISHETVRFWWNRFGPLFATGIRQTRVKQMRAYSNWQWHLDEVFVKINGETHYLWRAVDHEGEVLESYVTKRRNRKAALKFLRKTMKRHGKVEVLVTDKLRAYGAAMKVIGSANQQETSRRLNNRAENSHQPFRRRERAMLRFRRMRSLQKFVSVQASCVDLSRFDGAPLITFTATKEMNYGTQKSGRIRQGCGTHCADPWAEAQTNCG
ncbi:IS91-family transposase [Octadecabacter antarcticus 307]|uniref:IS91-family transposase n=1 Tax=Octadecabacter antarcticus 307 TaxID=391626 RepID=M9R9L1_9RHOB|nr:IS6 family transposase [Octadecabacter antarcticus]AGI68892.1 IS91-family transposase [Octadecabacter antarcticus 307]